MRIGIRCARIPLNILIPMKKSNQVTAIYRISGAIKIFNIFALFCVLTTGCSTIKKVAINKMGDALAEGGTTFTSDDDPELVKAAIPFSLKLMESLL